MADYVYVCAGGADDSLTIIDITNPAAPFFAGNIRGAGAPNFLNEPFDVFIRGPYAYVVSSTDFSLTIIDISNPTAPLFVGSIQGPGGPPLYMNQPHGIFVLGDYAYIAAFGDNALTIFNISNPAVPFHVGAIIDAGLPFPLLGADKVYVRGNYAYVAAHHSDALTIVDISNPALPVAVGSVFGAGGPIWLGGIFDVFVRGDYAYVPCLDDHALTVVDISNPAAPFQVGSIQGLGAPPVGNWLGSARGIWVVGNYAYVAASGDNALTIIDISNPAAPGFVGSIQGVGAPNWLQGAIQVTVEGDYAYVAAHLDDALTIINISNPAAPIHTATIREAGAPPVGNWLMWTNGLAGKFICLPTVTTDPATAIGTTSASLKGTLADDGGEACDCGFEWGETVAYEHGATPTDSKVTGQSFSQMLIGLDPNTTYHFRAFATNSAGTSYGADRSFTTEALPPAVIIPTVTTEPATLISQVSATLNGLLDDDGGEACECGFEWGLTDAYGHTTLTESKVTGETFSRAIGGLTPGTTYHFRAFATNSAGTGYGADRTFTTPISLIVNKAYALSREEL